MTFILLLISSQICFPPHNQRAPSLSYILAIIISLEYLCFISVSVAIFIHASDVGVNICDHTIVWKIRNHRVFFPYSSFVWNINVPACCKNATFLFYSFSEWLSMNREMVPNWPLFPGAPLQLLFRNRSTLLHISLTTSSMCVANLHWYVWLRSAQVNNMVDPRSTVGCVIFDLANSDNLRLL